VGREAFGTRAEVKNMNSFRSVERAIGFEIERQGRELDAGKSLPQETRGWDEDRAQTYTMRVKEYADDYRYFPEPDLPPLHADPAWLASIRSRLPELPAARRERYRTELGLSTYDAVVLVGDARATTLFEEARAADPSLPAKRLANWITGEYLRLAKLGEGTPAVKGGELSRLVRLVEDGTLSGTNAKQVFEAHVAMGQPIDRLVAQRGLAQISDRSSLEAAVDEAIKANPQAVGDVAAGKQQAIGALVGAVMKSTRGQANAALVQELIRERLARGAPEG
jgi:aspartyl-tRNA(Asn)/glutamyl-tRNA(Gln) amidotransferase subunit B